VLSAMFVKYRELSENFGIFRGFFAAIQMKDIMMREDYDVRLRRNTTTKEDYDIRTMMKRVIIDTLRKYFCKAILLNRAIYTTCGIDEQYLSLAFYSNHPFFHPTYIFCIFIFFYFKL